MKASLRVIADEEEEAIMCLQLSPETPLEAKLLLELAPSLPLQEWPNKPGTTILEDPGRNTFSVLLRL